MDKKEQTRLRVERYRNKQKSVTSDSVTSERYITLSDGQVFDREYKPTPNKHIPEMIAANKSDALRLGSGTDTEKMAKLSMICKSLDKEVTGLDGKKVNLLEMVRYGVEGPTFKEIQDKLS